MPHISRQLIVSVPADRAREVLGHHFDRIGDWATAISSSRPLTSPSPLPGAPFAGRVCRTRVAVMPEVTERLIAYHEAGREFTYRAEPLPWFLAETRNRWRVEPAEPDRSRISIDATVRARGVLGPLMYLVLRLPARPYHPAVSRRPRPLPPDRPALTTQAANPARPSVAWRFSRMRLIAWRSRQHLNRRRCPDRSHRSSIQHHAE